MILALSTFYFHSFVDMEPHVEVKLNAIRKLYGVCTCPSACRPIRSKFEWQTTTREVQQY